MSNAISVVSVCVLTDLQLKLIVGAKVVSIRSAVVAVRNVKMRSMICWCADFLVCAHSGRHIDLFGGFSSLSPNAVASYAESSRAVPDYFGYQFTNQCKNRVYPFISELMDFFQYSFFNVVLFTPPPQAASTD